MEKKNPETTEVHVSVKYKAEPRLFGEWEITEEDAEKHGLTVEERIEETRKMRDWLFRLNSVCLDELEKQLNAGNLFGATKKKLLEVAHSIYLDNSEGGAATRGYLIEKIANNYKNFFHPFENMDGAAELTRLFPAIRALYDTNGKYVAFDLIGAFEKVEDREPLWFSIIADARYMMGDQGKDGEPKRLPVARVKTFGMMNDKLNAEIMGRTGLFEEVADGQYRMVWGYNAASKNKPEVPALVSLEYGGVDVKTRKLTAFDEAVYNAISTLYYCHTRDFPNEPLYLTPEEIWRVLNGKQAGDKLTKPTQKQIDKLKASIDYMSATRCYINLQKQIDAHYITIDDERVINGEMADTLIDAPYISFTTETGRVLQGYTITREPVLYTYNHAKGTLLYFDLELLDVSEGLNNRDNVIEFRGYLLRQIKIMREHALTRDYSRRIYLKTLYEKTGIEPPTDRKAAKKDRDKIENMLTVWTKKGFIAGYAPIKEGKAHATTGYEIELPPVENIEEVRRPKKKITEKKK